MPPTPTKIRRPISEALTEIRKEAAENNEQRNTMGTPSMRPKPSPKRDLNPAQQKAYNSAAARSRELTNQMVNTQVMRQNWVCQPRKMQRIQRMLAKDPTLRDALFTLHKGGPIAFVAMDPKAQMQALKGVKRDIAIITRNISASVAANNAGLAPNPLDPLNRYNQANPDSTINQQQAIQQGIVIQQDNQTAQMVVQQDNNLAFQQQQQEVEVENEHSMQLTGADYNDVVAYNSEAYSTNPSPAPGADNAEPDDPEIRTGEKALEHAGEEQALKGLMEGDKPGMMKGLKGEAVQEATKETVEHIGLSIAKTMMSA